jgi:hypothetical protein
MSTTRASLATALAVSLGVALQAQSPLTNAQLLTKVTALEQEVARLTAFCPPPVSAPASPTGLSSLAFAAAEAAKVKHEWASVNAVPRFDPTAAAAVQAPGSTVSTVSAQSDVPAIAPGQQDEAYWKNRMRGLVTKRDGDQTFLAAAVTRERALDLRLHRNIDDALYIRDRFERTAVDGQWQDAVAEVSRLKAAVTNDTRAVADLEIEAHRASVPPGWLVIK